MGGKTEYSAFRMLAFALSGITSFSHRPLRLALLLGMAVLAAGTAYAAFVLWRYATGYPISPGWTSLFLTLLVATGTQLVCLGIACEYLGRMYAEVKARPLYVLRRPRPRETPDAD